MTFRKKIAIFMDQTNVQFAIVAVIVFNAILLGLETSQFVMNTIGPTIEHLDTLCLIVFIAEITIKLYSQGPRFFKSGWNIFDFIIVGLSLASGNGALSILRAFRILRVMRVVSVVPTMRRVVEGFIGALPGMGSVFLLMAIVFYIGAVMATTLFSDSFPQWFGTLGESAYSLFQIMTLESWSMGVVRPVMEVYPHAWLFFVPFIMVTTFAVMNLLVGLIVNSMQDAHDAATDAYRDVVMAKLEAIEKLLKEQQRIGNGDEKTN